MRVLGDWRVYMIMKEIFGTQVLPRMEEGKPREEWAGSGLEPWKY